MGRDNVQVFQIGDGPAYPESGLAVLCFGHQLDTLQHPESMRGESLPSRLVLEYRSICKVEVITLCCSDRSESAIDLYAKLCN